MAQLELLPISVLLPRGDRLRLAVAGHDAACFNRYGAAREIFTIDLGASSYLDLSISAQPRPEAPRT